MSNVPSSSMPHSCNRIPGGSCLYRRVIGTTPRRRTCSEQILACSFPQWDEYRNEFLVNLPPWSSGGDARILIHLPASPMVCDLPSPTHDPVRSGSLLEEQWCEVDQVIAPDHPGMPARGLDHGNRNLLLLQPGGEAAVRCDEVVIR